ncbi:MAG TPA: DnaD domain protein [Chloroflexia bacterium]|nr:DnaD domain protein [Chloroflexia bacterium]
MSKPFTGFSSDRQRAVRVPEGFFAELLPQITSMLEMKVSLHLVWRLSRPGPRDAEASPLMCSLGELAGDELLRAALAPVKGPRTHAEALREGLELAVSRGTLLQLWVREEQYNGHEGRAERWYLLNTRENREWVDALAGGRVDVASTPMGRHSDDLFAPLQPIRVVVERPNVYALYEQNIGLLTPMLAERLQDAEGRYPRDWIEAAFEEAVALNKRNWRYIERILERWASEGKQSGKDRGRAEQSLDPEKYTKGKYAFLFKPDR